MCAAALLVASVKPMSLGERVIIRTADAVSGVEYALPVLGRVGPRRAARASWRWWSTAFPSRSRFPRARRPAVSRDLARALPSDRQARLVS